MWTTYIHEFCDELLKRASFYESQGFEDFKKPFKNVEVLSIE